MLSQCTAYPHKKTIPAGSDDMATSLCGYELYRQEQTYKDTNCTTGQDIYFYWRDLIELGFGGRYSKYCVVYSVNK